MPAANREPRIDSMALARRCRAIIRERYALQSSCIETSFLLEQTALLLGLPIQRMVCQVQAFSPKLAEAMAQGQSVDSLLSLPGYWSVGVGIPQSADDFVGRFDGPNNRYVGHVVCIAANHLIDASADQMSRPQKELHLTGPVIGPLQEESDTNQHWFESPEGVVLSYWLHPSVPPPKPVTDKILKRLARPLADEFRRP